MASEDDEAALLAELKAISSARSDSRFAGVDPSSGGSTDDVGATGVATEGKKGVGSASADPAPASASSGEPSNVSDASKSMSPSSLAGDASDTFVDAVESHDDQVGRGAKDASADTPAASADAKTNANGGTFAGERGGDAHDEELLALLRGVSSKSTKSRFEGETDDSSGNNTGGKDDEAGVPWTSEPSRATSTTAADTTAAEEPPASPCPSKTEAAVEDTTRGGDAHDDKLLAELKAISVKSGRGNGYSDGDGGDDDPFDEGAFLPNAANSGAIKCDAGGDSGNGEVHSGDAHDEALLAELKAVSIAGGITEDPEPASAAVAENGREDKDEGGGFNTLQSFTGERGGSAEDAELLALLRGVSSKSSSNGRFGSPNGGDDDDTGAGNDGETRTTPTRSAIDDKANEASSTSPRMDTAGEVAKSSLPPWKRGKKASTKSAGGTKNRSASGEVPPWKKKTGPAAGMAKKSRIDDEFEVEISVAGSPPSACPSNSETAAEDASSSIEAPVVTSRSISPPKDQEEEGFNNTPTFTGERGGAAEDAELLALLRGVSSKSMSNNRFSGGEEEHEEDSPPTSTGESKGDANAAPKKETVSLPPWKRGKKAMSRSSSDGKSKSEGVPPWKRKADSAVTKKGDTDGTSDLEVAVTSRRPSSTDTEEKKQSKPFDSKEAAIRDEEMEGFKTSSTFAGKRGGAAEDEELLALLRGVSSKSKSTDRFVSGDDGEDPPGSNAAAENKREKASSFGPRTAKGGVPPWKRKKPARGEKEENTNVPVAISSNIPSSTAEVQAKKELINEEDTGGFKTSSTFSGERGGTAEDAELLALLRGVSNKSSGGNRFGENDAVDSEGRELSTGGDLRGTANAEATPEPLSAAAAPTNTTSASTELSLPTPVLRMPPQPSDASQADEPLVTRETLQGSLTSKDWKVRKTAYEMLSSTLQDMIGTTASKEEPSNDIDANTIIPSLDEAVPAMVKDSNAAALDAALKFAILYADYSKGASSSSQASRIIASLYKGSGLSASRPTTTRLSQALPLKLMEVGEDGPSSVHSVVEVLLHQGLASRKPKVVLNSVNLVLDAAKSFGAGALPVASVASSAPKILGHSNAKVREAGMNIIAEICRALGSKEPLQSVMDTLKPAQISQLDGLLEKQPRPTQPKVGLRYEKNRGDKTDAPDDVLAALEAGAREAAAKKLASRKAANIFDVLPKTEYASKLKQAKWSEKTGALDILIRCGGEQPYKLVQPSTSVSYTELIRDLRKLLEHTHFAVNSKAMAAISMLAEGVGEKLFPNLRPMLLQLIDLSKDKKLTVAVGKCLDSIFGNVLGFDHLLDKSDALPTALDERKQKNALARKSTLEFLGRCIERGESAGPRGTLTPDAAVNAARLACFKLKDSDAQPRKAAMDILQALRRIENEEIAPLVNDAISELKTDNPRAYKTLTASRSGGKSVGAVRANELKKNSTASRSRSIKSDGPGVARSMTRGGGAVKAACTSSASASAKSSSKKNSAAVAAASVASEPVDVNVDDGNLPSVEDAIASLAEFRIPTWDADEDDGGVLAGLKSSDWKKRKAAIEALTEYTKSDDFMRGRQIVPSPSILVAVKAHTKKFKVRIICLCFGPMFLGCCNSFVAFVHGGNVRLWEL